MPNLRPTYCCCDMKSFYASVECVARGLDPLKALLLVADESRSDKTIVLAVCPALKAIGVPSRPRLFEAKEAIRLYEAKNHRRISYIIAPPRMAEYIRVSALIYETFLKFVSEIDAHVYSIDELFIDLTPYLHLYREKAAHVSLSPAHFMCLTMIREVLKRTGITATVGIGPNLYLAKVGMDIVAKKAPPDKDGVRIAELDEEEYRLKLWTHYPLTDFWQIGSGTARKLASRGMYTMGDIATMSVENEGYLYELFGINAELLIDNAWGIEPATMADIKSYRSESHSLSTGQVLPRPYKFGEGFLVFREMADLLTADMVSKALTCDSLTWWVSFDPESLNANPNYSGDVTLDYYGRLHPKHANATVRLWHRTNSRAMITEKLFQSFAAKVDRSLLIRRLGISANNTEIDTGAFQLDMFTDLRVLERERHLQEAMLAVRKRYGMNAIVKGMNLMEGATTIERNTQIGGHRAGSSVLEDVPTPKRRTGSERK